MLQDSGADDWEVEQQREQERAKLEAEFDLRQRRRELADKMRQEIMNGKHDDLLDKEAA